ncbi:MAG: Gmad2 immunoglobulin-like domain-containing protein [Patescibacteria group bacterium]
MSKMFLRTATVLLAALLLAGCEKPAPAVTEPVVTDPTVDSPSVDVPVVDEPIGQPATEDDLIRLDQPLPEQTVSSPLVIKGAARGNWFFEGSFPVVLADWDGLIIAQGTATAESDWMTTDWVDFSAELSFPEPSPVSNRGALILKKDNPSGLPENDNALEITVFFE